ncbi:hypothetical protein H2199_001485 [Coniosporium tulheliwenetii]|uniref:Uncharacterized protein n=1 Tax=Coniosporium tulheliwenetii TaxID=3383036 RepID=A0ACC2ZMB8_9PEZI|nr:hypothetical protein H2199_001485 [Cladosporium sp. JES 115]
MHSVESTEESAAFFIDYCRKNRGLLSIRADDRTGGNFQSTFEAELVRNGKVHLSSPVASVEGNGRQVAVTTTTGKTFIGKKCIVSLPSAMFRDLNFSLAFQSVSKR